MIDFINQQTQIKNYIEENLPGVLQEMGLDNIDAYIDDYVDLDSYKKPKQLFYSFENYNYEYLSNESEQLNVRFTIYLSFIGNKSSILREQMLVYTAALHQMFELSGNSFGGVFDFGIIESDNFYNSAEGDRCKKVAEITFAMSVEN